MRTMHAGNRFPTVAAIALTDIAICIPSNTQAIRRPQYASLVQRYVSGLGVERDDTVAIMLTNRPEFHPAGTECLTFSEAVALQTHRSGVSS